MTAHLGPSASAFLDGALDASGRDEVLAHLAHCADCRAELAVQRGLRETLRELPGPCLSGDLAARLVALGRAGPPPDRAVPRRRRPPRRGRRVLLGTALLALGIGGTVAVAGPPPREPAAPVDPTSAEFIQDHSSISTEIPFGELDVISASLGFR